MLNCFLLFFHIALDVVFCTQCIYKPHHISLSYYMYIYLLLSLLHVSIVQVGWKTLAGHQPKQLFEVVTKLDGQVQSFAVPMTMAQKSVKMVEVAKMRKKKYYRLESEEKPIFPFQQKNFYSHIMENKEIIKTLTLLSMCTQNVKTVNLTSFLDVIIIFIKASI